jgi:hypothetical protein
MLDARPFHEFCLFLLLFGLIVTFMLSTPGYDLSIASFALKYVVDSAFSLKLCTLLMKSNPQDEAGYKIALSWLGAWNSPLIGI